MNNKSPISKFLYYQRSGTLYHIAYEFDDLDIVEKEIINKKSKLHQHQVMQGMECRSCLTSL